MSSYEATPGKPTMFTTSWCGYCARLKGQLKRAGIEWTEVDIESAPGRGRRRRLGQRRQPTVPTLLFSDGSSMTNPSASQVDRKLAELR